MDEKKKEFERITKEFIDYLYKYATPHTTIIITQCGAEQCEGDMAIKFKLRD